MGIDVDCVLVLDIVCDDMYLFLCNCCFGMDVGSVVWLGWVVVDVLLVLGVLLIIKYMLGYGWVCVDSYKDLFVVDVLL